MTAYHIPVMPAEVIQWLAPRPGGRIVDGTLGGGGHSRLIAPMLSPGGTLIGIDQDPAALEEAGRALADVPGDVEVLRVHSNFSDLRSVLESRGIATVDGILLDLGVSSHQLDTADRGFAFRYNGPLDMRMNPDRGETAADLANRLPESELAKLLFEYGEEPRSRRIAAEIVRRRAERPLQTTEDLVDAVRGAMPFRTRPGEIHPATRTFQAFRIAVNRELDSLREALRTAADVLAPSGRLVVLSYHSLEDRIVKTTLSELSGKTIGTDLPDLAPPPAQILSVLTRKPLVATPEEVRANPRARSAKLRAAERR